MKVADPTPWAERAACRDSGLNMFPSDINGQRRVARLVCPACPVRGDCLEHALTRREEYGVWGGLTESERRKVLRRRRLAGAR